MNWKSPNILILIVAIIVVILVSYFMPEEVSERNSFSARDHIPWGCEVLYEELGTLFPDASIYSSDHTLYEADSTDRKDLYLFINSDVNLSPTDLDVALDHVHEGSSLFISSTYIQWNLLDSLQLYMDYSYQGDYGEDTLDDNSMEWLSPFLAGGQKSSLITRDSVATFILRSTYNGYLNSSDTIDKVSDMQILGYGRQPSDPQYVRVALGKGHIYLHLNPYAFTNYHILDGHTRDYTALAFSHLPEVNSIYWDEYYKDGKQQESKTSLSVLLSYRGTRIAWRLLMILFLIYAFFETKRRQKAIPVIQAPTNNSIQYAQTIGSLYYNGGSDKIIFDQKVAYFRSICAQKYGIKKMDFDPENADLLSRRSATDPEELTETFQILANLSQRESISQGQLKAAAKRINNFYRNTT